MAEEPGWNELLTTAKRRVGTMVKGKWHIDALLGCGGMAAVYSATHRNRNRAALKILWPQLSADSQTRKRFLREAYAANTIDHPSIVRVFDDDVNDDGAAFLVMELLEGATLGDLRQQHGGKVPVEVALSIADPVLDALAAAHDRGIIHRDIKPSNIFVTRDSVVKILDFGIARVRDADGAPSVDSTKTGHLLGSVQFMSPEQARAQWKTLDGRTDIYSLGATIFHLITGEPVHPAVTEAERLAAAARLPARSLASVAPQLPHAVVTLIDRALAFEPDARWPDCRSMQKALRECYRVLSKRSVQETLKMTMKLPESSTVREPRTDGGAVYDSRNDARTPPARTGGLNPLLLILPLLFLFAIVLAGAGWILVKRSRATEFAASSPASGESLGANPPVATVSPMADELPQTDADVAPPASSRASEPPASIKPKGRPAASSYYDYR